MADRKRVFGIAHGEAAEAAAVVRVAALTGDCSAAAAERALRLGNRALALLTGLVR